MSAWMLTLNTADRSHVARILSLVNLAPDIVTAVMTGKAPRKRNADQGVV